MITVHHAPRARSTRVVWMLEEMGLPYELKHVEMRQPRNDAFLAGSPSGMLPLMEDGEVKMVESIAMLQYLGDRYGPTRLAPASNAPAYPDFLQFLHLGESSLAAMLTIVVISRLLAPEDEKANWGAEAAKDVFQRRLSHVSRQLGRSPYMAGDDFTAADISVGYTLGLGSMLEVGDYDPPVADYLERLRARPAYQRALAA